MTSAAPSPRDARPEDIEQLLPLWASLFAPEPPLLDTWVDHARAWFVRAVGARDRGRGFGTTLVDVVIEWARSIDPDCVDLSATPRGSASTNAPVSG